VMDVGGVEELGELVREKFAGVVGVEASYDADGGGFSFAKKSVEAGDEGADVFGGITLPLEAIRDFEAAMVIDEDKDVASSAVGGRREWSGDIGVDEASRVRGFVCRAGVVGEACGVGFYATRARCAPCFR